MGSFAVGEVGWRRGCGDSDMRVAWYGPGFFNEMILTFDRLGICLAIKLSAVRVCLYTSLWRK